MAVNSAALWGGFWHWLNAVSAQPPALPIGHNAPLAAAQQPVVASSLTDKPLRYLIGRDTPSEGADGEVTEVGYDVTTPAKRGISIAYCNLFDESNSGKYGPYLHSSDTAEQYNEGQIDPRGLGWGINLHSQFVRRKAQGFQYIELDNPDAYSVADVVGAVDMAGTYGLKVICKNPLLMDGDAAPYVSRCHGAIVERGAGSPADMDVLRVKAGKPDMPVWFVAFGLGKAWTANIANHIDAKSYRNMSVTYSSASEYGNSIDVLRP